jgi:hypothetical protein
LAVQEEGYRERGAAAASAWRFGCPRRIYRERRERGEEMEVEKEV